MRAALWIAALAWAHAAASAKVLYGEDGKEVYACKCIGQDSKLGSCDYHKGYSKPWCLTLHRCGDKSADGHWMYCDAATVERRHADDGKFYNWKEYSDYYGASASDNWNRAAKHIEEKIAGGKAYPAKEFREYYISAFGENGWAEKWKVATEEKRKADDGKMYTYPEFEEYYGVQAWYKWESAEKARGDDQGLFVSDCTCEGAKTKLGNCDYHKGADKPWCLTAMTGHGRSCGKKSSDGYWMECDAQTVERRRADDGKFYNWKEFSDYFGASANNKWNNAWKHTERRLAANNKAYSAQEFRDYYIDALGDKGWADKWTSAREETRKAKDGKWYKYSEFEEYFGKMDGWRYWEAAYKPRDEL